MRSHIELALALVAAGCAFEDGQPWGRAEMALNAAFAPPAERRTPDGDLETADSYALRLEAVEVAFDGVTVHVAGEDAPRGFDPARPPPGFSLCHNGHCHADDGRLVPYDQVAIEAGLGGGGGFRLTRPVAAGRLALGPDPTPVALGDCPDDCLLRRGVVRAVELRLIELHVRGRVFDLRPRSRLPADGVAFEATVPLDVNLVATVDAEDGRVDEGEPIGVGLFASFALPAQLFDGVAWPDLLPAAPSDEVVPLGGALPFREALDRNLRHFGGLIVEVHRFSDG